MTNDMLISVIIPTFNRAWCLQRAISSVLNQSYENYELIIVDDHSSDDTEELVRSYGKKIIYEKLEKNFGVNYARNKGFDISHGDVLVFLDSDDELLPNALKTIDDDFLKYEDVSLIAYNCIDSISGVKTAHIDKTGNATYHDYICEGIKGELFQIIRRNAMVKYKFPEFVNGVEGLFWFEVWKDSKVLVSEKTLRVYHTETPGSIMKSTSRNKALSFGLAREKLIQNFGADIKENCPNVFSKLLYITGLELSWGGMKDKGISYLKQSYAICKDKKTLFLLTLSKVSNQSILRFLFSAKRSFFLRRKSKKLTDAKPIHLIYLIGNLGAGGAEKLVHDLAIGLDKSKFRVSIVAIGNYKDRSFEEERIKFLRGNGVEVKIISKSPHGNRLNTIRTLRKILKMDPPDIIHAHLFTGIFYGTLSILGMKIPMVVTYHSTSGFGIKDKIISKLFSKKLIRVIAVSESVKTFIHNYFKVPIEKITTIYNGIDTKKFSNAKDVIDPNSVIFGCVGRLVEPKGYHYIIDALSKLKKENLDKMRIKVAGEGPLKEGLKKQAESNKISQYIEFVGNVTDIPKFLSQIDVFVAPSLYEGFGIALIEAMAAGKPVLISDIDVFREILGLKNSKYQNDYFPTDYGVMFKTRDSTSLSNAIEWMLDNKDKWEALGQNAQRRAKLFDISKTIEEHQKLYLKIFEGRKK